MIYLSESTSKSNISNSDSCVVENKIHDLECTVNDLKAKQSRLDDITIEQRELQKQVLQTSTFIDNTIIQHKSIHTQLTDSYNMLWSEYQKTMEELDESMNSIQSLNVDIDELKQECKNISSHIIDSDQKNQCLKEENNNLQKCLIDEKNEVASLKSTNLNQIKWLENYNENLDESEQKLSDKTNELVGQREKNNKLKIELDLLQTKMTQKISDTKLIELKLIKCKKNLQTDIMLQKNRNLELEKILCTKNSQQQELKDTLNESNQNVNTLKRTLEENRNLSEDFIDKLQEEKCHAEEEREKTEKKLNKLVGELKEFFRQNERLKTQETELRYKSDTAKKMYEVKEKQLTENLDKTRNAVEDSKCVFLTKNKTIKQLEEQLSEARFKYKTEIENMLYLKQKLENLRVVSVTDVDCRAA